MEPEAHEQAALEERLRAALAARSALVTAQSLRPAGPPRAPSRPRSTGRSRSTWRWPRMVLVAGAVAAAAALAVLTLPFGSAGPDGRDGATGREQHRSHPIQGKRIDLDGLSLTVPSGWVARQFTPGRVLCITRREVPEPQDLDDCGAFGAMVAIHQEFDARLLDFDDGWSPADQSSTCWNADGSYDHFSDGFLDEVKSSRISARGTVPVSGQKATYRAWRVTCAASPAFTIRLWWIPKNGTMIRADRLSDRDAEVAAQIVSSITLR